MSTIIAERDLNRIHPLQVYTSTSEVTLIFVENSFQAKHNIYDLMLYFRSTSRLTNEDNVV